MMSRGHCCRSGLGHCRYMRLAAPWRQDCISPSTGRHENDGAGYWTARCGQSALRLVPGPRPCSSASAPLIYIGPAPRCYPPDSLAGSGKRPAFTRRHNVARENGTTDSTNSVSRMWSLPPRYLREAAGLGRVGASTRSAGSAF